MDNEPPPAAASAKTEGTAKPAAAPMVSYTTGIVFMLIQVLCSSVAGVYNEYLIKGEGADVHIMIQNVFMYLDSILCNLILLGAKSLVLIIILNNAILGIIT